MSHLFPYFTRPFATIIRMGSVAGTQTAKESLPVLCVDLDGTLIRSNLLWECILLLIKSRPGTLLLLPFWLIRGRAYLKHQVSSRVHLDPARLPYRQELLELLRQEKLAGRRIALVTAADQELAQSISEHLGVFDEVYASDGRQNLKGATKASFLADRFALSGFDYVGDSAADLHVWRLARAAYVVGRPARAQQAAAVTTLKGTFPASGPSFRIWGDALRGHHWAKNLLLFLPLFLSHNLEIDPILRTAAGFVIYGFCASGLYILNDLLDLHSDREHPWKNARPFAAGEISIPVGLFVSLTLICSALSLGFFLDPLFGGALLGYAALTMIYSIYLKKLALLDVFVLASFYSFRILAGALISATPLSQWFLAFSMFVFLSLAMAKRYSELLHANNLVASGNSGRGYRVDDRELILALGVGSSFSAVVILSLYVHSQDVRVLYLSPEYLFLLCPIVLYWLSRIWLQAHRGELKEDPVTLAIHDPVSYAVAAVSAGVIAASMMRMTF